MRCWPASPTAASTSIATDHAPHHYDEKHVEFDRAPFGIVGLETAVPLAFDRLVHAGVITLARLIELMSVNPARILRIPGGSLAEGAVADITILAPDLAGDDRSRAAAQPLEEHAVSRLVAPRRRRRDDRRRPGRLRESQPPGWRSTSDLAGAAALPVS